MLGLILDTSTDQSLIALTNNGQILACKTIAHGQNLSQNLLPSINKILEENKVTLKELSKISIGIGPGSYTGTRISVAVAESLSLALSIPLYPFCSLLAFLPPTLPQGPFAFIIHPKNPSWFALKGYFEGGQIQIPLSQHISQKQELLPFLEGVPLLLSFHPDTLSEHLSDLPISKSRILNATPNVALLVPYLSELEKSPTQKPEIIYLHNF